MTDFTEARRKMVDGQIRPADVTDLGLIAALLDVRREAFVPPAMAALAYLDNEVALGGDDRRLLKPMLLAKLIQAAEVGPNDRVLVVGAGTGYSAAILGRLAHEVVALEETAPLARRAMDGLREMRNVTVVTGGLTAGWSAAGPYDVILVDGAVEEAPQNLLAQLAERGRLVCVLGAGPAGKAMVFRRSGSEVGSRPMFDAAAAVLPGFAKAPVFAF